MAKAFRGNMGSRRLFAGFRGWPGGQQPLGEHRYASSHGLLDIFRDNKIFCNVAAVFWTVQGVAFPFQGFNGV